MVNLVCHYPKTMSHVKPQTLQKNGVLTSPSSISPSSSSSSSSSGKISPAVLFIIIIIAVIFFISGLLHLLVRFLTRQRSSLSSTSESHNNQNHNNTSAFQRQLQQLFHLHDSGLDQSFIDSLPVFVYREIIMGSKEPFDCAVCLCEFSEQDKLRLLPLCSHAFHIDCIDTWLLSNSTCPLCRATLYSPGLLLPIENPIFYFGDQREEGFSGSLENQVSVDQKPSSENSVVSDSDIHKRVFSVRLGKLRNINVEALGGGEEEEQRQRESELRREGETSSLDSRRCFSMGSYKYVVGDSDLQVVALRPKRQAIVGDGNGNNSMRISRGRGNNNNNCGPSKNSLVVDGNYSEGKKIINIGSKGESFSQSKIWQWPRKGKFPSSSQESHLSNTDFSVGGLISQVS